LEAVAHKCDRHHLNYNYKHRSSNSSCTTTQQHTFPSSIDRQDMNHLSKRAHASF
jgi:hypothetical protein